MDRWDKIRKHKRNQSILKYRLNHPHSSNQMLGNIFHLSRERIRIILKNQNQGPLKWARAHSENRKGVQNEPTESH